MEHQMESYLFAKSMTQQSLQLIKELSDEELPQLISTLSTTILKSGLEIREPKGDVNRQSLNLHQCAVVGDKFMRKT